MEEREGENGKEWNQGEKRGQGVEKKGQEKGIRGALQMVAEG